MKVRRRGGSGVNSSLTVTDTNANSHVNPNPNQAANGGIMGIEPMEVDAPDLNLSDDEEGGTRIGDIYIPPPIKPYCSTESKGPRLIIRRIENFNFKSYAGHVILGPFHHCFTAIIGPNGSGKSNVIDSMLFVFGYRAQKIRCKKLSTLLHSSKQHPDCNMCSVSVHFEFVEDEDNGLCKTVPNSEFIVTRTAYRDNSSFYAINGKKAQFKEVSRLLKQHGVDLDHNRFLILQGEVESIAMMKPKGQSENECGMLEYLEDIVGTSRYKDPLAKIYSRVEALTEERTEKHNRCKLAEREMKDLEQPFNEAIDYLKLENTLTRTKNLQIQKYLSTQKKKLQEFGVERAVIETELKEHSEKYNQLKNERLEKEAIIKKEIAHYENLCKQKEEMEQKLKASLNNFTEVQVTMTATNKRRKQNKSQLEKCKEKLEDLKKLPSKNQSEISECEKQVEKLTKEKEEIEKRLQENYTQLESETRPLINDRDSLETNLIDLKKNVDEAKGELSLSESELNILRQAEITEKRKYDSLKSSYEEQKVELKEKEKNISGLHDILPELKTEIDKRTKELHANKEEEESIRNRLIALKADINESTRNMQLAKTNNKVLDSLMRQKAEGKICGIFGRLGDLGGIDNKYDVAISTACGRLDNIIVDTVNTAQACIEHLKRYDIGRASFIALEKVNHLEEYCRSRIQTPENVPRLFDLVNVEDERVLPAFYFALRNTLVANDLEQGTRIAYGATRFRVVTLRGDVIETSGTMSGGGKTQMRGKMGNKVATKTSNNLNSSVSQKALDDMQKQAEEMQSRINYLQEQQGILEREIEQMNVQMQKNTSEINKLKIQIRSLSEQLPRIQKQVDQQKKRTDATTTDPAKVKALEDVIATKKVHFEISEKEAKKIKTKIDTINEKIANIHGTKIKSLQQKIDSITKQVGKINGNISKLKAEITTSERNVKKVHKEIEDLTTEIKNAEESIVFLNNERTRHDQEGVEWSTKIEQAKEEIEKARNESSEIKNEIIALQKKESDGKLKHIEIEEKLQTLDKKIADVKDHLPHWQSKLKPLKLNEIPGETEPLEPLKTYTEEELNTYKLQDLQYQYSVQEEKLNSKKPNLSVIQEYMNKREVYLERVQILEDITNKRNEMRQLYDDIRKKRYTEFMQGFHIITRKLKEMYQMITQGGDAELELVDSMDPFTEGVTFSVRPPKKTWKNISNLSGGEKTLSSLALVFALHYYKPSPLYFMDEIDAALDFKNISIVAYYIKERTKNAQFIIISLRTNMFELSNRLVGIYKITDSTMSLSVNNTPPEFFEKSPRVPSSQNEIINSQESINISLGENLLNHLTVLQMSPPLEVPIMEANRAIAAFD